MRGGRALPVLGAGMTAETPAPHTAEHRAVEVLIVGAGQAGLGTGYWLSRRTSASQNMGRWTPSPT